MPSRRLKGVQPPLPFGERTRDCSPGHAGKEGPQLARTGASQGFPQPPNASRPALLRLSDHLLANYKKGVRPVRDWRTPTTVSIDVIVYAILSVVSARPHCPAPGWTF